MILLWRNADDLPPVDLLVLVYLPREEPDDAVWLGYWDGVAWRNDEGYFVYPSHWMQLPEPPAGAPINHVSQGLQDE